LIMAHTPYFIIKNMGRWSSDAAQLYICAQKIMFPERYATHLINFPILKTDGGMLAIYIHNKLGGSGFKNT